MLRLVCDLLVAPGNQLRTLGLRGSCLLGLPPGSEHSDGYSLAGVVLLCEALRHESCVLQELDVSDTGMKAAREEQPPSRMPATLYGIGRADAARLAALHPAPRAQVLRLLDYPALFLQAERRGLELPPLEVVAAMEAPRLLDFWGAALNAERDAAAGAPDAAPPPPSPGQVVTTRSTSGGEAGPSSSSAAASSSSAATSAAAAAAAEPSDSHGVFAALASFAGGSPSRRRASPDADVQTARPPPAAATPASPPAPSTPAASARHAAALGVFASPLPPNTSTPVASTPAFGAVLSPPPSAEPSVARPSSSSAAATAAAAAAAGRGLLVNPAGGSSSGGGAAAAGTRAPLAPTPRRLGGRYTSLMARHLSTEIFDALCGVRTSLGFGLDGLIWPGVARPGARIGVLAGDAECYDRFAPLLDRVVEDAHGWSRVTLGKSAAHKSDLEAHKIEPIKLELPGSGGDGSGGSSSGGEGEGSSGRGQRTSDAISAGAARTRLVVRRNLAEAPFVPAMDLAARALVESALRTALDALPPEFRGEYTPLAELSAAHAAALQKRGLLGAAVTLQTDAALAAEAATDAAEGGARGAQLAAAAAAAAEADGERLAHRGVFEGGVSDVGVQLAALVNHEDHLELVAVAPGAEVRAAFERLYAVLGLLEAALLEGGRSAGVKCRLTLCDDSAPSARLMPLPRLRPHPRTPERSLSSLEACGGSSDAPQTAAKLRTAPLSTPRPLRRAAPPPRLRLRVPLLCRHRSLRRAAPPPAAPRARAERARHRRGLPRARPRGDARHRRRARRGRRRRRRGRRRRRRRCRGRRQRGRRRQRRGCWAGGGRAR